MRYSILIRAFNEEDHIGRILEGVRHQTLKDVEIVLVDSGSTDATTTIAARYGAKVVHLAPTEFTFGRSLNLGLAATTGDFVVIASAHVYPVYPDWFELMLAPFADQSVALSYGKQRGDTKSWFSEQQVFTRWYPNESTVQRDQPFCNNANAAIRRSVWVTHPYDETLSGLEDLDWAKWAQEAGFAIVYVAEAEVVHVHNENQIGIYNRYRREAMAFKHIYPEAHFSLYDLIRNITASIGFDMMHASRAGLFWQSLLSIFWYRTVQFWGTYQGYRQSGLLTPDLRQTFYYHIGWQQNEPANRDVEPIRYNE